MEFNASGPNLSNYGTDSLEVDRRKAKAVLIYLEFGNPMKKSVKAARYPPS
jgi:hypothetical protein